MKIGEYSINMASTHDLTAYSKTEETLVTWVGDEMDQEKAYLSPVKVNLSPEARNRLASNPAPTTDDLADAFDDWENSLIENLVVNSDSSVPVNDVDENPYLTPEDEVLMDVIENLYYQLTGEKVELDVFSPEDLKGDDAEKMAQELQEQLGAGEEERVGWGLDYSYHEINYEREVTEFQAEGVVKTADGREIHLDITMRMSREFMEEKHLSIKAGDALIDPLVINFTGAAPELSDQKIVFDLDMDGNKDNISYLKPGSGFLALDKNNDGKVNDGNELFGPQSGNGFDELAKYDDDGNGWIDENDSVFTKLKVWSFDQSGNSKLLALKDTGVGAIYLGHASTEFSLNNDNNQQLGQLRNTGLYLNENGTVGKVHELDLVV